MYRTTSPTVTFAKMCQINIDKINLGNDQCQYSSSFYIDMLNNIHGISIIFMLNPYDTEIEERDKKKMEFFK